MLTYRTGAETAPMTVYIIADLDSPKGMALMSNAIAALVSHCQYRTFVMNVHRNELSEAQI